MPPWSCISPSLYFLWAMNRAPKRQRTHLRGFHSDWVAVDDDDPEDFVHAREGGVTRKGIQARLSMLRREPERALDSWTGRTFWPTPDSVDFALDASSDLYDQLLEANVMDELLPPTASTTERKKKRKKNSETSVSRCDLLYLLPFLNFSIRRVPMLYGKNSIARSTWMSCFVGLAEETSRKLAPARTVRLVPSNHPCPCPNIDARSV